MNPQKVNNVNINILDYIPVGHENAVTRKQLRIKTGLEDRLVRNLIHLARRDNAIINLQDGKGYFKPDPNDESEIKKTDRWLKQETGRLKRQAWSMMGARIFLKERETQDDKQQRERKTG